MSRCPSFTWKTRALALALLLAGLPPAARALEAAAPFDAPTAAFLKEHCYRCHGGKSSKGDLRLDRLDTDLTNSRTFDRWLEVATRMQAGEMPPDDEAQPPAAQVTAIVRGLGTRLAAAAAQHRTEGSAVLRRLNRVEYENTVRDLFGVTLPVKEMLPEDTVSQGFDNLGAALNVSPVLMERYLEAADAVLDAAVAVPPAQKIPSKTERFQLYDSLPSWFVAGVYKQDDGVVLFRTTASATALSKYRAPAPGRYRFRISASAYQSPGPVTMSVMVGNFVTNTGTTRHLGYFDAPPGQPAVIEIEDRIDAVRDSIKVQPVALPFVYLNQQTLPNYPGPGLYIHWIEVEGPLPEPWPTESYRRLYGDVDPAHGTLADAEKILRRLLPKAFRHPVLDPEAKPFVALVAKALEGGQPFDVALRAGIKGILASPKFLYFREKPGPLDDYALASRLSYFLWSTMPDDALLDLAAHGQLRRPGVLRAQVERMLQSPKAKAFTDNFTGQWLGLRNIALNTPDKVLYPEFEELLQWSMVQETQLFFDELLKQNLSVRNFIDSDFSMLNERLAQHYGIEGIRGVGFRKVALKPEYHRGGVLTQASVLKVTANGTTTSPVVRGAWVLDRIIGRPAQPPPANVPAIEPDIRGAVTIREQLGKHRSSEICGGCHRRIDPPGFALENYDVVGGWRERYRTAGTKNHVNNRVGPLAKYLAAWQYGEGLPVEAGDKLADGREFTNIDEFKKLLLAKPDRIARAVTEKLMTYATGHRIEFGDHFVVDGVVAAARQSDYGLRTIVHDIVESDTFLNK